jgi:ribosomal protein L37E
MTGEELTVIEAIARLEGRGFTGSFHVDTETSTLLCAGCGHRVVPSEAEVVELFRFEGPTDPGEEAIVVGLRCRRCGREGTLVSAYGAAADAAEAEVLVGLGDARYRR